MATYPKADFDINDLNILIGNGVSGTKSDRKLFKAFASVSGLNTEALLKIGKHAAEASDGFFVDIGSLNSVTVTDFDTYEQALTAADTENAGSLTCKAVFQLNKAALKDSYFHAHGNTVLQALLAGIKIKGTAAENPLKTVSDADAVNTAFADKYCEPSGETSVFKTSYKTNFATVATKLSDTLEGYLDTAETQLNNICAGIAANAPTTVSTAINAIPAGLTVTALNVRANNGEWDVIVSELPSLLSKCTTGQTLKTNLQANPLVPETLKSNVASLVAAIKADFTGDDDNNTAYYNTFCSGQKVLDDEWDVCSL